MSRKFGVAKATYPTDEIALDDLTSGTASNRRAIQPGERACCCPAPPSVRVVLVSDALAPHPIDLLLCGHHYRRSIGALSTLKAMAFDHDGYLLPLTETHTALNPVAQPNGKSDVRRSDESTRVPRSRSQGMGGGR